MRMHPSPSLSSALSEATHRAQFRYKPKMVLFKYWDDRLRMKFFEVFALPARTFWEIDKSVACLRHADGTHVMARDLFSTRSFFPKLLAPNPDQGERLWKCPIRITILIPNRPRERGISPFAASSSRLSSAPDLPKARHRCCPPQTQQARPHHQPRRHHLHLLLDSPLNSLHTPHLYPLPHPEDNPLSE